MPPSTTVEINGHALRHIRVLTGVDIGPLADQVDALVKDGGSKTGVSRAYLNAIELGMRTRVSPKVYTAINQALAITDRRVLLANPHASVLEATA